MRKLGKVLPLDDVVPVEPVLDPPPPLLLPPPPQPAAISATPTAKAAASSHFPRCVRFKFYLPVCDSLSRRRRPRSLSARCILPDVSRKKLVRTERTGAASPAVRAARVPQVAHKLLGCTGRYACDC